MEALSMKLDEANKLVQKQKELQKVIEKIK